MRTYPFLAATAVLVLATQVLAQTKFPAVLEGHATLPAMTLVPAPADAPQELQVSGHYAGPPGLRIDSVESVPAMSALSDKTAPRPTGVSFPLKGQPVQGLSGTKNLTDGKFLYPLLEGALWSEAANGIETKGSKDGKLTFSFFTIENVDIIDVDCIIVGNDNNLPFSSGRALDRADDNELILLKVGDLLKAK